MSSSECSSVIMSSPSSPELPPAADALVVEDVLMLPLAAEDVLALVVDPPEPPHPPADPAELVALPQGARGPRRVCSVCNVAIANVVTNAHQCARLRHAGRYYNFQRGHSWVDVCFWVLRSRAFLRNRCGQSCEGVAQRQQTQRNTNMRSNSFFEGSHVGSPQTRCSTPLVRPLVRCRFGHNLAATWLQFCVLCVCASLSV